MSKNNPVLLTFSKKNSDVKDILDEISLDGTKKTDFICDAVRFYYKYKNSSKAFMNEEALEKKVEQLVHKYISKQEKESCPTEDTNINISSLKASDLEDD